MPYNRWPSLNWSPMTGQKTIEQRSDWPGTTQVMNKNQNMKGEQTAMTTQAPSPRDIIATLGQRYRDLKAGENRQDDAEKSERQKLIEASIEQQMLYEKWIKQDQWGLRLEALPLLAGAEPEDWSSLLGQQDNAELEQALWTTVVDAVEQQGSPLVQNRDADPEQWQVKPQDIHYWCRTQAIAVPSAFDMLISFVASTVKKAPEQETVMGAKQFMAANTSSDREKVLGAGLAMVCTFPEQCRDQHGWVDGYTLASLIKEKGALVFDDQPPVLDVAEMAELLDGWIKKME